MLYLCRRKIRRKTKDERLKMMGPMGLIRPMGLMGTIGFS